MKRLITSMLFVPLLCCAAIQDWDYTPFISFTGQYPGELIKKGSNFDLLLSLWEKPQALDELKRSGLDLSAADTTGLMKEGMIYRTDGVYYSAIPFIDSLATKNLREAAKEIADRIISETENERNAFFSVLETAGCSESAFSLVHSLVFDDAIWENIGVSPENSTIWPADSMTWNGVFYFFRPESSDVYGTNGIRLDDNHWFKFAWGENSNGYLCAVFTQTQILQALRNILKGEELTEEMVQDCKKFGVLDNENRLRVPILDGQNDIRQSVNDWCVAAAEVFNQHFDGQAIGRLIGWNCNYNEAALKVILYHEVLSQIAVIMDEKELLKVPDVLRANQPADKTQTASVSYITLRN